jgi:hypothetical protein
MYIALAPGALGARPMFVEIIPYSAVVVVFDFGSGAFRDLCVEPTARAPGGAAGTDGTAVLRLSSAMYSSSTDGRTR